MYSIVAYRQGVGGRREDWGFGFVENGRMGEEG
jgi:hypothetical protein